MNVHRIGLVLILGYSCAGFAFSEQNDQAPPPAMTYYSGSKRTKKASQANLNSEVTQSRCVPFRDANTGEITGTSCDQGQTQNENQGRFQQLGLQRTEVMMIDNGNTNETKDLEPVDSIQKAMERYNTMKTTGATQLENERQ